MHFQAAWFLVNIVNVTFILTFFCTIHSNTIIPTNLILEKCRHIFYFVLLYIMFIPLEIHKSQCFKVAVLYSTSLCGYSSSWYSVVQNMVQRQMYARYSQRSQACICVLSPILSLSQSLPDYEHKNMDWRFNWNCVMLGGWRRVDLHER